MTKKGAYENVFTEEMEKALGAQRGHRIEENQKLSEITDAQERTARTLRIIMGVGGVSIAVAALYMIVSDPASGPLVMAMVGIFLIMAILLYLVNRK